MKCPRDNSTLTHDSKHVLAFHACRKCHGLWFEMDRLQAYLRPSAGESPTNQLGIKPAHRPALETKIGCPQCFNHRLIRKTVHGVEVDICRDCKGVWLDAGELDAIVAWHRKRQAMGLAAPAAAISGLSVEPNRDKRSSLWDGLDVPAEGIIELSGQLLEFSGKALEYTGEAAIAVVEFLGELLSGLDFSP